jgi:hypothetical protein
MQIWLFSVLPQVIDRGKIKKKNHFTGSSSDVANIKDG